MAPLHVRTWLAPSLPLALFEALAERIEARVGRPVRLTSDAARSGPRPGRADPFARGEVDIGFLCSPSWAWLADGPRPSIVAVPALPVPTDPRAEGRPVYFSDVVVAEGSDIERFEDLRGRSWAYNDACSLSGRFAVEARVGPLGGWFGEVVASGSHLASLALVAQRRVAGAAIDSTVLGWALPAMRGVCVLTSFGPHPIQPVVARADLDPDTIAAVAEALVGTPRRSLAPFGLAGFAPEGPGPVPEELRALFAAAEDGLAGRG